MSTKQVDAELILRLYELRREAVLREARAWFIRDFQPKSAQDVIATSMGPQSAYMRMVVTYWEMAATLVNHGAIDTTMFHEANGEHVAVYAKMEPFLGELRQLLGNPRMGANLEKLVKTIPDAAKLTQATRERLASYAAAPTAR